MTSTGAGQQGENSVEFGLVTLGCYSQSVLCWHTFAVHLSPLSLPLLTLPPLSCCARTHSMRRGTSLTNEACRRHATALLRSQQSHLRRSGEETKRHAVVLPRCRRGSLVPVRVLRAHARYGDRRRSGVKAASQGEAHPDHAGEMRCAVGARCCPTESRRRGRSFGHVAARTPGWPADDLSSSCSF